MREQTLTELLVEAMNQVSSAAWFSIQEDSEVYKREIEDKIVNAVVLLSTALTKAKENDNSVNS